MRTKLIYTAVTAIIITVFVLWSTNDPETKNESTPQQATPSNGSASSQKNTRISKATKLRNRTVSPDPNLDERVTRYTDGSVDLKISTQMSSKLHQDENPKTDLRIVSQILSQYRVVFKKNPVGVENFEFSAALSGNNPKQVNFIDPSSPALSENNELVDRWGSPIYFHPLSGTEMELRSLGPDKTLWTADDIELKP